MWDIWVLQKKSYYIVKRKSSTKNKEAQTKYIYKLGHRKVHKYVFDGIQHNKKQLDPRVNTKYISSQ